MDSAVNLAAYGIDARRVFRNPSPAVLYEHALASDAAVVTSTGAIATLSGAKTGRSPKDKRIVRTPGEEKDVWWGDVNIELPPESFMINRQRAIDYLSTRETVYVIDGFAGWDPKYQIKIRIICSRPYHALFMHNMLIRPTAAQLASYGDPDYVIFNAGEFRSDPQVPGVSSDTCVALNLERQEMVILGTQYAGEMKKGVFTILHYLMPKRDVLSMHCSINVSDGGASIFFGLSGTGKTTLSADPNRHLVGDDEHCWTDEGVFNIEGGCYAKCIDLSADHEPEIFNAIRFGSVLENTVQDPVTRVVDFADASITQNTRASYPIEYIPNAKIPCTAGHPNNLILLTCDAFGVLPPVSKLTPEQAMYHFTIGYTAKVAGTEVGVTEPEATFSPCFGAAFLVWHPMRYAEMLERNLERHGTQAWLVNTGWTGGGYGVGERMSLPHTRAIIDAIHSGELRNAATVEDPIFRLAVPTTCPGVPTDVLQPKQTWSRPDEYEKTAKKLASLFDENYGKYAGGA